MGRSAESESGSDPEPLRAVYSTGVVARFLGVCPRTANKLFDSGQLRGYRIPGGIDRRVPGSSLAAYLSGQPDLLGFLRAGSAGPVPQPEALRQIVAEASRLESRLESQPEAAQS